MCIILFTAKKGSFVFILTVKGDYRLPCHRDNRLHVRCCRKKERKNDCNIEPVLSLVKTLYHYQTCTNPVRCNVALKCHCWQHPAGFTDWYKSGHVFWPIRGNITFWVILWKQYIICVLSEVRVQRRSKRSCLSVLISHTSLNPSETQALL